MKLDQKTLSVLKNYASNNSNLLIKVGNKIETISEDSTMFSSFTSDLTFDKQISIYNLNEFLGVISVFDEPELDLEDAMMTIKAGNQKVKYLYAEPSYLLTPTDKVRNFPESKISLELSVADLANLKKMSQILSVSDFSIFSDGSTIKMKVFDKKQPSTNDFEIDTGIKYDFKFDANFKIDKLKLHNGSYVVDISEKRIARFTNKDIDLYYFIAMEADSRF